jgi:hypothetical protein
MTLIKGLINLAIEKKGMLYKQINEITFSLKALRDVTEALIGIQGGRINKQQKKLLAKLLQELGEVFPT